MRYAIAFLIGLIGLTAADGAVAETLKVAVAQRGFWNSSFVDFAQRQGFFKDEGLDIDILYTEGGASTLTPVVAGSLDIAMSNGTLGVIAAFAKGMPVKIISAETTGAPDVFWYARPESGIKSIKDTDGKTVAFSSPGSSTNLTLLQLIHQEHVQPKLVATGGAPATLTQVMTGQIDVGWSVPPFVLQHLAPSPPSPANGGATGEDLQIIARGSDVAAIRDQTIRVNVANANALATKRDAFVRYIRALNRAIDWAYSGAAPIEAYAALANVPVALAQRTRDEFFPKAAVQLGEVRGLDLTLKQALEYKYITAPLSVADVQKGLIDILYK